MSGSQQATPHCVTVVVTYVGNYLKCIQNLCQVSLSANQKERNLIHYHTGAGASRKNCKGEEYNEL
jgi:hypothetical protein